MNQINSLLDILVDGKNFPLNLKKSLLFSSLKLWFSPLMLLSPLFFSSLGVIRNQPDFGENNSESNFHLHGKNFLQRKWKDNSPQTEAINLPWYLETKSKVFLSRFLCIKRKIYLRLFRELYGANCLILASFFIPYLSRFSRQNFDEKKLDFMRSYLLVFKSNFFRPNFLVCKTGFSSFLVCNKVSIYGGFLVQENFRLGQTHLQLTGFGMYWVYLHLPDFGKSLRISFQILLFSQRRFFQGKIFSNKKKETKKFQWN